MLRVSPFYDHYTIRIRASCHNNTAPPIKLNKLSCSNTNLILLKQSCLIGQLNIPKLVNACSPLGCVSLKGADGGPAHLGILGRPRPRFPSVLLRASDLYSPPAACLAGDLPSPDGMTLGRDAGLTGGQEPLAQQRHCCPGAPPCLPSQSVQGSGVQHPPSQPDLS